MRRMISRRPRGETALTVPLWRLPPGSCEWTHIARRGVPLGSPHTSQHAVGGRLMFFKTAAPPVWPKRLRPRAARPVAAKGPGAGYRPATGMRTSESTASGPVSALTAAIAADAATPLPPLGTVAWNHAAFGPRPGDVAAFDALGASPAACLQAWVDRQLQPGDHRRHRLRRAHRRLGLRDARQERHRALAAALPRRHSLLGGAPAAGHRKRAPATGRAPSTASGSSPSRWSISGTTTSTSTPSISSKGRCSGRSTGRRSAPTRSATSGRWSRRWRSRTRCWSISTTT